MAEHGAHEISTATGNDIAAHENSYVSFLKFTKYGLIFLVVLLVLMAWFLV